MLLLLLLAVDVNNELRRRCENPVACADNRDRERAPVTSALFACGWLSLPLQLLLCIRISSPVCMCRVLNSVPFYRIGE